MAVARRNQRTRSLLVALVLVAITLVTVDSRSSGGGVLGRVRGDLHDGLSPVQTATHSALAPIGDFFSGAAEYGSLRAENTRLRQELAGAQAQEVAAAAATAEADAVIAGEHLPFNTSIPKVEAQVIDQGSSNFDNDITIDRGRADGLVVGQPVVAAGVTGLAGSTGGLVGSVEAVSAHTADVELLTAPGQVVGVSLPAGNVGTAEGIGPSQPLHVSVISTGNEATPGPPPPKITRGQPVATSGLPLEQYPPGIPVGTVASVILSQANAEPAITLTPLVDLAHLSVVEVELWSPQTPTSGQVAP